MYGALEMRRACRDVGMVHKVRQCGDSVPDRIASRILVHMLVEELDGFAPKYTLINRVGSGEVLSIDRVFREAARLEAVFWYRQVVHQEGSPSEELRCVVCGGPA